MHGCRRRPTCGVQREYEVIVDGAVQLAPLRRRLAHGVLVPAKSPGAGGKQARTTSKVCELQKDEEEAEEEGGGASAAGVMEARGGLLLRADVLCVRRYEGPSFVLSDCGRSSKLGLPAAAIPPPPQACNCAVAAAVAAPEGSDIEFMSTQGETCAVEQEEPQAQEQVITGQHGPSGGTAGGTHTAVLASAVSCQWQHQSVVRLVLTEGKNRMVRKMLAACGHPVRRCV